MIKRVFSVFDVQAKIYVNPFYQLTVGEAVRAFGDSVKDGNMGALHKHPEDFFLYELAEFDDVSGVFTVVTPPRRCAAGVDFVEPVK